MLVCVLRVPRPNLEQAVEVPAGATVLEVLRRLSIPPDAVIVVRNEQPLPLDAPAQEGDRLRVVSVFSGG